METASSVCLTKKPGSRYWYVGVNVKNAATGKWRTRWTSTRTEDEDLARERFLEPIRATIENRKAEEALRGAIEAIGGSAAGPRRVRLEGLWEFYLEHAQVTAGEAWMKQRRLQVTAFVDWVHRMHPEVVYVHEVSLRLAGGFWKWMEVDGKSPNTRNKYRSSLKTVWDGIAIAAELPLNPWNSIAQERVNANSYRALTLDQVRELVRVSRGWDGQRCVETSFWECAIMMGMETGLRQGDIATLEAEEIRREEGYLVLVPNKTKKWSARRVSVHSLDRPWVRLLPAVTTGFLWPKAAAAAGGAGRLGEQFAKLCELANIAVDRKARAAERRKGRVKLVTFHSLRHTFATYLLEQGVDQGDLVAQGNWANEGIINRVYNHAHLQLAKEAADRVAAVLPEW